MEKDDLVLSSGKKLVLMLRCGPSVNASWQ
jgi:hypothetical protein